MCVPLSFFYFSWFSLSLGSTNMLIISIGFGWKWWRWWCGLERFLNLLWEVFSAGRCFDTLVLSWARFMWSCSPVMNRKSPWNAKFFILLLLVFFVHIYIYAWTFILACRLGSMQIHFRRWNSLQDNSGSACKRCTGSDPSYQQISPCLLFI